MLNFITLRRFSHFDVLGIVISALVIMSYSFWIGLLLSIVFSIVSVLLETAADSR